MILELLVGIALLCFLKDSARDSARGSDER